MAANICFPPSRSNVSTKVDALLIRDFTSHLKQRSFMFPLFNFLLGPFVPALWLYTLHRRFVRGKSAASYAGQWGQITPQMREFGRENGPKIWLHAVSVGETMAARPLARALKARMPNAKIVLSSTTDTGHEVALSAVKAGEAELAIYYPLDLPFVLTRVLNALKPDAIGFVETELWPNTLELARRRGIRTFQLNGRVSDNLLQVGAAIGAAVEMDERQRRTVPNARRIGRGALAFTRRGCIEGHSHWRRKIGSAAGFERRITPQMAR